MAGCKIESSSPCAGRLAKGISAAQGQTDDNHAPLLPLLHPHLYPNMPQNPFLSGGCLLWA